MDYNEYQQGALAPGLTYAMFMYEQINRNVLITILEWKVGIAADFTKSAGKAGKYLPDFLPAEDWEQFEATYSDSEFEHIWEALFTMCSFSEKRPSRSRRNWASVPI